MHGMREGRAGAQRRYLRPPCQDKIRREAMGEQRRPRESADHELSRYGVTPKNNRIRVKPSENQDLGHLRGRANGWDESVAKIYFSS